MSCCGEVGDLPNVTGHRGSKISRVVDMKRLLAISLTLGPIRDKHGAAERESVRCDVETSIVEKDEKTRTLQIIKTCNGIGKKNHMFTRSRWR